MRNYTVTNIDDLSSVSHDFIESFRQHRLIAFYGSMGAGKTTFIKALCDELKVTDVVNSPSFAIINEYAIPGDGLIYHFDFYRLKSISEAYDMGYEDYFYSGNLCFIEWPELVEEILPEDTVNVNIEEMPDGSRRIRFD